MTPHYKFNDSFRTNQQTILSRLNSAASFDKELAFDKRDQLYLVLSNLSDHEVEYLYKYDGQEQGIEDSGGPDCLHH